MTITKVRPLDQWPRERRRSHTRSPFSATWTSTMKLLDRELGHLGAPTAAILIDTTQDQIRVDGTMPLANAKVGYPGVVIAFDSREHGPLKYISDRFNSWQDNVRAIALGLEALRKVDRYGITSRGEQYQGWAALGTSSGIDEQSSAMVIRNWAEADHDAIVGQMLYRHARSRAHPDRNHGDQTGWDEVEAAGAALGLR